MLMPPSNGIQQIMNENAILHLGMFPVAQYTHQTIICGSNTKLQPQKCPYSHLQHTHTSFQWYSVICEWKCNIGSRNVSGGSICTLDNAIYISYQYTVTGKPISTCPTAVYIFPMLSGNLQMEMNIASGNVSGGSIYTLGNVIQISYQCTVTGKPISTCPTAVYIFLMLSGNLQME